MLVNEEKLNMKKKLLKPYLIDGGFYGNDNKWNALVSFPFDPNVYRDRVETIIIRDQKEVFVKKAVNGEYRLPGGSKDKDVSDIDQAMNECMEEARINVRNIKNSGYKYKEMKMNDLDTYVSNPKLHWNAGITTIYVAEYDSLYTGRIEESDKDPFILSGRFYSIIECLGFFRKEHRDALTWYLQQIKNRNEFHFIKKYSDNTNVFIKDNIKTPKDLSEWMKENIHYDFEESKWKLRTPNEVYKTKIGNSHDQTSFEDYVFNKLHITHGRILATEKSLKSEEIGNSHSFLYFMEHDEYFWFENALLEYQGIHGPYNTLEELENDVERKWLSVYDDDVKLSFTPIKNTKYGMNLNSYKKACYRDMMEGCVLTSNREQPIYFISDKNLGIKILHPRIPSNYFTRNGYEDKKTRRVTMYSSIDGSIMGLEKRYPGQEYYVYIPVTSIDFYVPDRLESPSAKITKEVWVRNPVKVKPIGKIRLLNDKGNNGYKFSYGKHVAELYDWEWEWVEKMNTYNLRDLERKYSTFYVDDKGKNPESVDEELTYKNVWEACKFYLSRDRGGTYGKDKNLYILTKDYNLVKVADVDIYKLDSNYEDFKYSVKNIKIDKSVEEFKESADNKIYFLSEKNMDNQILQPRIPDNYFTKNGYEDKTTKRVCFSKSIDGSLMGLSKNLTNHDFYVHVPSDDTSYYSPSTAEVPDSKITKEVWVKNPVKVKCIGKIHVSKDKGLEGHKFKYGDKVAELYDWEWKWVEKESAITESTLKTKDRNRLDDSEFGLPELRKYPLNDREHVLAAIRFFNRCPYGYEEELAKRIKRKMKEFKISSSIVGNKNNLNRYL